MTTASKPHPSAPITGPCKRRFLEPFRGNALASPPIWLMRQAGRYLPEYRELDGTNLELNQMYHLADIKLPEGVSSVALKHGQNLPIVAVNLPREEEIEVPVEAAAAEVPTVGAEEKAAAEAEEAALEGKPGDEKGKAGAEKGKAAAAEEPKKKGEEPKKKGDEPKKKGGKEKE